MGSLLKPFYIYLQNVVRFISELVPVGAKINREVGTALEDSNKYKLNY